MTHVVAGDDSVIVPPPPREFLAHTPAAPSHPHIPMLTAKSLEARRTFIPILLTTGVMFFLAGVSKFIVGDQSPIADYPAWMPIALFSLAGTLLIVAILNMLQVRSQMARQASSQEPGVRSTK